MERLQAKNARAVDERHDGDVDDFSSKGFGSGTDNLLSLRQ